MSEKSNNKPARAGSRQGRKRGEQAAAAPAPEEKAVKPSAGKGRVKAAATAAPAAPKRRQPATEAAAKPEAPRPAAADPKPARRKAAAPKRAAASAQPAPAEKPAAPPPRRAAKAGRKANAAASPAASAAEPQPKGAAPPPAEAAPEAAAKRKDGAERGRLREAFRQARELRGAAPAPARNGANGQSERPARGRRRNGADPAIAPEAPELIADLEFLNEDPFKTELRGIRQRQAKIREVKRGRTRENPLLDLNLLANVDEALIRGVSIIRQSLRDLLTGETARIVDSSSPGELEALGKQLETRKLIMEAALKELSGQLQRLRNRQREAAATRAEAGGRRGAAKAERGTHAAN